MQNFFSPFLNSQSRFSLCGFSLLLGGCLQTPILTQTPGPVSKIAAVGTTRSQPMEERKQLGLTQQEPSNTPRNFQPVVDLRVLVQPVDKSTSSSRGKEILCSPAVLRPGETLTIKTSRPFNDALVRQPKQSLLLVSSHYPEGLTDPQTFKQGKTLEIRSDAKVKPNMPVFTSPGVYTFVVGMNVETDDGTPSYSCNVRFLAK